MMHLDSATADVSSQIFSFKEPWCSSAARFSNSMTMGYFQHGGLELSRYGEGLYVDGFTLQPSSSPVGGFSE